jgi:hypothetical protein
MTEVTYATGDSKNIKAASAAHCLAVWSKAQTAGEVALRGFDLGHDPKYAFRTKNTAADCSLLTPRIPITMKPGGQFTLETSGSATSGDLEYACMLNRYVDARTQSSFLDEEELRLRATGSILVQPVTLALGTAGGYSGEVSIVSSQDNFKSNALYALVGYKVSAICAAIGIRPTGGARIGAPGDTNIVNTREFFRDLSIAFGDALMPLIDPADKNNITIDGAQDENGTDTVVNLYLAELRA